MNARPLAEHLIEERLTNLPPEQAGAAAAAVIAARAPEHWDADIAIISQHTGTALEAVRRDLHTEVEAWNRDPRQAAQRHQQNAIEVRARLVATAAQLPRERWARFADHLDARLTEQGDWPALAQLLQDAHDQGHDVPAVTRALLDEAALGPLPAQDLRYRLAARLPIDPAAQTFPWPTPSDRHRPTFIERQAGILPTSPGIGRAEAR